MTFQEEHWTTHDQPVYDELIAIEKRLTEILDVGSGGADAPSISMPSTFGEARIVIHDARRQLLLNLLGLETHEHWLDDCGDDTQAATERWVLMFAAYFNNDLDEEATLKAVQEAVTSFNRDYGEGE